MDTDKIMVAAGRVHGTFPEFHPKLAIVMGSGWHEMSHGFQVRHSLDYAAIPELGVPQVVGHGGQLLLAEQEGVELLIFAGRRHWYEGVGWEPIAFPICLAKTMGAESIVLTNSAGGIRESFRPGAVMMIADHINLMGVNPLIGAHHPFWGARFPDMTRVYDLELRRMLVQAAQRVGICLELGVYMAVTGPSYETPAEVAAFRRLGADAVGMSTVPEAVLAHAAGLKVAGLSCITNTAAGVGAVLSHEDVLAGAKAALPQLTRLLQDFVRGIGKK